VNHAPYPTEKRFLNAMGCSRLIDKATALLSPMTAMLRSTAACGDESNTGVVDAASSCVMAAPASAMKHIVSSFFIVVIK
jgi:hypothetical protein